MTSPTEYPSLGGGFAEFRQTLKEMKFLPANFFVLGGLHVAAVAIVIAYFPAHLPGLHSLNSQLLWLFLAQVFLPILGITFGYHRGETHGAFKMKKPVKAFFLALGGYAGQGTLLTWAGNHRKHHKFTDRPGDPHSPWKFIRFNRRGEKRPSFWGFLFSHTWWLFYETEDVPNPPNMDDLENDPMVRFQSKQIVAIVLWVMSFVLPFLIAGWSGLFIAGVLAYVVRLNITWSINSVTHIWGTQGDEPSAAKRAGNARNIGWLAIFTAGESWHWFHHALQACAAHGYRWWHVDVTKYMIWVFERLHLVTNVRWMPEQRKKIRAGALIQPVIPSGSQSEKIAA